MGELNDHPRRHSSYHRARRQDRDRVDDRDYPAGGRPDPRTSRLGGPDGRRAETLLVDNATLPGGDCCRAEGCCRSTAAPDGLGRAPWTSLSSSSMTITSSVGCSPSSSSWAASA